MQSFVRPARRRHTAGRNISPASADSGDAARTSGDVHPEVLLSVERVTKRFGRTTALADFSFDLRAGEVHALVGHNGSGKSTFVKVLAGYHQPEPGAAAVINDETFALGNPQVARSAGLRFVYQDLGLVESLDATDNMNLGSTYPSHRFRRINWRAARDDARQRLAELGYEFDVTVPAGALPLVHRTGIAIAKALQRSGPPIHVLILDEPTAALPAAEVADLFAVITKLRDTGLGIVYISHHLEEVFAISDRVTVLRDGRHVATRATKDLSESTLIDLMVGGVETYGRAGVRNTGLDGTPPVLTVTGISSGVLRDADLEVWPGEIVGIAGVAGSGREEFAGVLFGATTRRGDVTVGDHLVPPSRPDAAIARGLGLLPADRARTGLIYNLSVLENLTLPMLPARFRGVAIDRVKERQDVMTWLGKLDIRPTDPDLPVGALSGGNQQKLLLGRWLRVAPKVLILDEPTQGVDVGAVARIYGIVREYAEQGLAFLVCSSDTDELVALCDRVVILSRGAVVGEVSGADLRRDVIDRICLAN
jgi:ribose transport system ATP-binding protein